MKTADINIRDPYVLVHEGKYYLYGTRSATCWSAADGFDCYVSGDLENWEGPIEIFHRAEGFFADRNYWAPECYFHEGWFYLLTTLGAGDRKKGVYCLVSDSPAGPFSPYSERLTPADWDCIDGTLWFENGKPYMGFSHSLEPGSYRGDFCLVPLTSDLKRAADEPMLLFRAADAPWARPIPFAEAEFGIKEDVYFSDGPSFARTEDGTLWMLLSSWGERGYAIGAARSESGSVRGPWRLLPDPLYPEDGGHGMLFRDLSGRLLLTLHSPDTKYAERPIFLPVECREGRLRCAEDTADSQKEGK